MSDAWNRLVRYSSAHHAVISVDAARTLGIAYDQLRSFQRAGRLVRRAQQVYVVAGSPVTCRTAAALWELDGFPPGQIEVITHHGTRRRREHWMVHETRRLRGVDLDEAHRVPCTAVTRTILDLAAVADPLRLGEALDHACRRWPGMLELVKQRFLELAGKGRKGSRVMRALLAERLGQGRFAESGFEASAGRLVRAVGLPEPQLQYAVRNGSFIAYLDLAWPKIMFGLECDSLAWHSGKKAHEHDRKRRRRLKGLGWDVTEVTYDDVTKRRAETGAQLRELYFAREEEFLSSRKPPWPEPRTDLLAAVAGI